MARLVFGRDVMDRHPVMQGNINVNSPLIYDHTMSAALRVYATANQCVCVIAGDLRRCNGAVVTRRRRCADPGRRDGGHRLGATRAPRVPGGVRQLSFDDEPPVRRADVRLSGGQFDNNGLVPAGASFGRSRSIGRRADHGGELSRRTGNAGQRGRHVGDAAVRRPSGLARCRLARRRIGDVLREVRHGPRPLRRDAQDAAGIWHGRGIILARCLSRDRSGREFPVKRSHPSQHTRGHTSNPQFRKRGPFETWTERGGQTADQRVSARWLQTLESSPKLPELDEKGRNALDGFVAERKASMPDESH